TLRVKILKSEGSGYDTYHLFKVVDAMYTVVMERNKARWDADVAAGVRITPWDRWSRMMRTQINDRFCAIFQAAKFRHFNDQKTRLHSKLVLVSSPSTNTAAVSVGSLNLYNALMMNDYGNIVFHNHAAGTVTKVLEQRFDDDW